MMWPYAGGWSWGWMVVGWIMMLVFWGLVVVGIAALLRAFGDRGWSALRRHSDTATEILRRRYAAGEITKEQFEEMKRTLA